MSPAAQRARAHGFTLIEVLIALLVVSLGIGALLTTLSSAASNLSELRDRSFAEWVALNRISEVRLGRQRPEVGTTDGETEFAGSRWRWRQVVSDPEMAGMLRLDVSVARAQSGAAQADQAEQFESLVTAFGFIGTAVAPASGIDPDWSLDAARAPGGPGGPGGPGDGGGPRPPAEPGSGTEP